MSRLSRVTAKIFGSLAGTDQRTVIGSTAAGSTVYTTDPDLMQTVNYEGGWYNCVLAENAPTIQDMNSLHFLLTYQIACILESGIVEYSSTTNYYIGSLVTSGRKTYVSLVDNNLAQSLSDQSKWYLQDSLITQKTSANTLVAGPNILEVDATAGSFIQTLPPLSNYELGEKLIIKCINTNANSVTIKGNGSETIDGVNTYGTDMLTMDSLTLYKSSSTKWFTI